MKGINNSIYTAVDLPTRPSHPFVTWFDEHGYNCLNRQAFFSVFSRAHTSKRHMADMKYFFT